MNTALVPLWRVFPWEAEAEEGKPFSASYVPGGQGRGRFDLSGSPSGVLYLAEVPEHAVAEMIQPFRNQVLDEADLVVEGRTLARVSADLSAEVRDGVVDLCDPAELVRLRIHPDEIAARTRATTQRIASSLHAAGYTGLRWWPAFFGEWHTVILFRDRLPAPPVYGAPHPLHLGDSVLAGAARRLDIELPGR